MRRDVAAEMGYVPGKQCPDCATELGIATWPLDFFNWEQSGWCRRQGSKHANCLPGCPHACCYSARCTGHMLTARTGGDIFAKKIARSFRRHAADDGITLGQLLMRWGTTTAGLAAKYRTEYETGRCPKEQFGCGRTWKSMPNGARDMTFDRINPAGPFLPHNVAVLCITCNVAKAKMPPERFAVRHRCWQIFDDAPKLPRYIQETLL